MYIYLGITLMYVSVGVLTCQILTQSEFICIFGGEWSLRKPSSVFRSLCAKMRIPVVSPLKALFVYIYDWSKLA